MKIKIAKSAGFCFGVKRALKIALDTTASRSNVQMLGDIVHNEDVIKTIDRAGIKKIKKITNGKGKTLLIRAHGASNSTIEKANTRGYSIIDATCPMVKEIHRIARNAEKQGYHIIIIGDKKHDEVRGIIGQLKHKAIVIDNREGFPEEKLKKIKKAAVVIQSTQNIEKVSLLIPKLKKCVKDLKFFNTICKPTITKQSEIKTLPLKNNIVIIIGSKTSANTRRLYEIAKSLNKNSYWVQSKDDLRKKWFRGMHSVGITAGASTPDEATNSVVEWIQETAK